MASYERLSPQDSTFLYIESPTAHMHVAGLSILDAPDDGPPPTLDDIRAHIDRRLHLVPRFRKRLMWVPLQQGRPVWVDDENFDLHYHVRHTALASPGSETELKQLVARLQGIPLDRSRPLWELWVIDMPNDRRALFQKTHHALIDGISGVDLATVLLDITPEPAEIPKEEWHPEPAPSPAELLVDSLRERATEPAEMFRSVRAAARRPVTTVARELGTSAGGMLRLGKSTIDGAPKTSLTRQIGAHRRIELVRTRLDDVKRVKDLHATTVNDVVLAMVAGGLRKMLLARGDNVDGLTMRVMVPVSVRTDDQRKTFGNQVSAMFAALPVGEPDPLTRLRQVQDEMAEVKDSGEAIGAERIMRMADFAPPTLLALSSRLMGGQGTRTVNLVVTNVPGPQFPLYMLGTRMLEAFPIAPVAGDMTICIAVLSYDGQLNFGLNGDWDAVPDLAILAEGIEKSLGDLDG